MRFRKTWQRSSRVQAQLSFSSALASLYTGIIDTATIFVAWNLIRGNEIKQRFSFLFLYSLILLICFLLSSECIFTLVIVSLLMLDIKSLLHTHVTFFCIVFTSAYSRLYPPSDLYTVRWNVSLSLSWILVVHLHTHSLIDWSMLSREPPMRIPRRTNLGQIVDNLLLNKMKNKSTFETKWAMFPGHLHCIDLLLNTCVLLLNTNFDAVQSRSLWNMKYCWITGTYKKRYILNKY